MATAAAAAADQKPVPLHAHPHNELPLSSLLDLEQASIEQVKRWLEPAQPPAVLFPPADEAKGEGELVRLQVSTRSPLGAVVYETAGVVLQGGLIRLLGCGGGPVFSRSVSAYSKGKFPTAAAGTDKPSALIVADDALGGVFAVNGGGIPGVGLGSVAYFCPSGLQWDDLAVNYSTFLQWLGCDRVLMFYEHALWAGWEVEVGALKYDEVIMFNPPLWAGGGGAAKRERAVVGAEEAYRMMMGAAAAHADKDKPRKSAATM